MRRPIALSSLAALAVMAPSAAAQDQPAPEPTPPPPPAPAAGAMTLKAEKVHLASQTTVTGRRWRVRGHVTPVVAGEKVVVRFFRDGKKVHVKQVAVQPDGQFVVRYRSGEAGVVRARAVHAATPAQVAMKAAARPVTILPVALGAGSRGRSVRVVQRKLRKLGYVTGRRGLYDARTGRAVLAFRKVSGLSRTTVYNRSVAHRIAAGGGHFRVRFPKHGRHVEADLSRQVIALVEHGEVQRIYPTSSGKPSTPTVLGHYRFYSKLPGFNAKGMYFSNFFIRGYAIHGYHDVPTYNASHGCLRIPNPDAYSVYKWIRIGDRIDVYL